MGDVLEMVIGPVTIIILALVTVVPIVSYFSIRQYQQSKAEKALRRVVKKVAYCPKCNMDLLQAVEEAPANRDGTAQVSCQCGTISKWDRSGEQYVLESQFQGLGDIKEKKV